jgi:hypothetical protein
MKLTDCKSLEDIKRFQVARKIQVVDDEVCGGAVVERTGEER